MTKNDLKKKVEYILSVCPDTRNDDKLLTIELWKRFYPQYIRYEESTAIVKLDDILFLPSQEAIKRLRAVVDTERFLRFLEQH